MKRVFSRPSYAFLAALLSVCAYILVNVISAFPLMWQLAADAQLPISKAFSLVGLLFVQQFTDVEVSDVAYSLAFAVLFGINTTLLIFFFKMYRTPSISVGPVSGVAGAIAAFLSFGCSACGSVFAAAFLASIGGSSIVTLLPLDGAEFGIIGFALLLFSIWYLARSINKPVVCPI